MWPVWVLVPRLVPLIGLAVYETFKIFDANDQNGEIYMYGVLFDTVLYLMLETNHSGRKIVQDL